MKFTRRSPLTGKMNTLDLDVTLAQVAAFDRGVLVQDAFPHLSAADREFLISGSTAEDWATMFPPEVDKGEEPDGFTEDCAEYKTASNARRIELEEKWGARASYFTVG